MNPTMTPSARDAELKNKTESRGVVPPTTTSMRHFAGLRRHFPNLLVLLALAGIGAYGHYSHWKVPKFSALIGATQLSTDDWCEEHNVPESNCVECNLDRFPSGPDYGWCPNHGIHNCVFEHPDVAQLKRPPVVSTAEFQSADRALALKDRPKNNAVCTMYQRRIQFASIEAVAQAGIDVQLVDRRPVSEWVSGTGEITYDATRFASLSPRVAGTAWHIFKNIGDPVREGDILAVVDAMAVGQAKSELVRALVTEDLAQTDASRLAELGSGVVATKHILEAEAILGKAQTDVLSAEQALANLGLPVDVSALRVLPKTTVVERLQFLGLPAELIHQLDANTSTANLIPIRSSMNGVVVDCQVVSGEVVDPSHVLFTIADTSNMWLSLDIALEEVRFLSLGQPVWFWPDGSPQEVSGELTWISTGVDQQTRMVKVRAELPNPDGQLRAETFGTGRVVLREEQAGVVVPKDAIHWEGCCHTVFVRDKDYFTSPEHPKLFHVRSVRIGATDGETVEIIAGLLPGEVIATKGSDVLRSQLLKNNLGAGCCAE